MAFTVWVYSASRDEFPVDIATNRIHARELRAAIARERDAAEMSFTVGGWGVFEANSRGEKIGEKLPGSAEVRPAIGASAVNVWVEPIAFSAAIGAAGEFSWVRGPNGSDRSRRTSWPRRLRILSSN